MASYDAVTLDEAKMALNVEGTAEDETLARLITALTLEVERRLGTAFVRRAFTEYHDGGGKRLFPLRSPIYTVTSITDPALNVVAATDYVVRQERWLEHYGCFPIAYNAVGQRTDWTVVYVPGWFASTAVVTADVRGELLRALAAMRENPNTNVSSVHVGDLSIGYRTTGESGSLLPIIEDVAAALYQYRGTLL